MEPTKCNLHLVKYSNPSNGRCHRIWLFRRQIPQPDTSMVHSDLKTRSSDDMIMVEFKDAQGGSHYHKYPMINIARTEQGPDEEEKNVHQDAAHS